MERLSIADTPQPMASSGQDAQAHVPVLPPPMTVPQLPAQMFTTAAQLLDLTDSERSCRLSHRTIMKLEVVWREEYMDLLTVRAYVRPTVQRN